MKFGIILCRRCRRGLGVQLRFKITKCPYCGTNIKIESRNIKYHTENESDLAEKIAKINEQLDQQLDSNEAKYEGRSVDDTSKSHDKLIFGSNFTGSLSSNSSDLGKDPSTDSKKSVHQDLDPLKRIAFKYKSEKESITLIKLLATNLYNELGEFSIEELSKLFTECGLDVTKVESYLEHLKELNIIYEPRPGIFKIIED